MTLADLADYQVAIREPLTGQYRGWTLATMPPPSSGGLTLLQMLGMLEGCPLGDVTQGHGFGSAKTLHVMTEAMRLAFADRAIWIGDGDAAPLPRRTLLHPQYLTARRALIQVEHRMPTPSAGDPTSWEAPGVSTGLRRSRLESPHTTHFAVADRWGNVITWTSTIESTWGSGITVPSYGFLLNNELPTSTSSPPPTLPRAIRVRTTWRPASDHTRAGHRSCCLRTVGRSRRTARPAARPSSTPCST